ncbi:MAG: hypothetical protein DRH17_04510 [Deltaproteobacteria bacterium]|nr:MAG: hypothetical protein DRH17_04510 [Deltaproteobacteria bacterium]
MIDLSIKPRCQLQRFVEQSRGPLQPSKFYARACAMEIQPKLVLQNEVFVKVVRLIASVKGELNSL